MGTVWLKTKEDKGMNMLIPHSPNFANANVWIHKFRG